MADIDLGKYGVWRHYGGFTPESAAEIERLGYGTLWLGGSPGNELEMVEPLLQATTTLKVATGIVNIWSTSAKAIAESVHRIDAKYPGRFLLGVGVGHPEATAEYRSPYQALVDYLDELDQHGVPADRRVLAALGPKVLTLSTARGAGAHPYLTTPEHTREAREILGTEAILAPEQKVVLDDHADAARAIGRKTVDNPYLHLKNYVNNLKRLGFTDADIADGGSDRLIDALALHGSAAQIAAGLRAHIDAGADHVAIQVLPPKDSPIPTLSALAEVLFPH
ncbi:LLM class F420-dependent oxidoreductase [Antrihabitans cavernicola]|uniref:LLM class F420-dependent oxidoreductase n=1 Tax=Antrihabitans cavernicola TaxID=2495913 RepID=A0A5A7S7R2_9NOCA|nr:LLM class F420-dependent oxidoreductase [Spelaeibacter cavernicola]KAA0021524.1 LLM class F420-dependent oxidoreductase [Spelaeibacter cavernicola]